MSRIQASCNWRLSENNKEVKSKSAENGVYLSFLIVVHFDILCGFIIILMSIPYEPNLTSDPGEDHKPQILGFS